MRHVEDAAGRLLHLLQGEHRLAAPGGTDDHQRRGQRIHLVLFVVERDWLVEQVEVRAPGIHVRQLLGFREGVRRRQRLEVGQLGFVDRRAAGEEPRLAVGMTADVLEHEDDRAVSVPGEREQDAVGAVELGTEQVVADLLRLGGGEVLGPQVRRHLCETRYPIRIEAVVEEYLHGCPAYPKRPGDRKFRLPPATACLTSGHLYSFSSSRFRGTTPVYGRRGDPNAPEGRAVARVRSPRATTRVAPTRLRPSLV